jgi:arginine/lysine/ornithine decarboxylase
MVNDPDHETKTVPGPNPVGIIRKIRDRYDKYICFRSWMVILEYLARFHGDHSVVILNSFQIAFRMAVMV